MNLFLDANVIFAATISPDGRCSVLFELAKQGYCSLITSPHAMEETRRNLTAKYPTLLNRLETDLIHHLRIVQEASTTTVDWAITQGLPLKDAPILAAAIESGVDLLVTGDKTHFGFLYGQTLEGVKIVSPQEALLQLLSN